MTRNGNRNSKEVHGTDSEGRAETGRWMYIDLMEVEMKFKNSACSEKWNGKGIEEQSCCRKKRWGEDGAGLKQWKVGRKEGEITTCQVKEDKTT